MSCCERAGQLLHASSSYSTSRASSVGTHGTARYVSWRATRVTDACKASGLIAECLCSYGSQLVRISESGEASKARGSLGDWTGTAARGSMLCPVHRDGDRQPVDAWTHDQHPLTRFGPQSGEAGSARIACCRCPIVSRTPGPSPNRPLPCLPVSRDSTRCASCDLPTSPKLQSIQMLLHCRNLRLCEMA